jgi:hypothetical protein
MWIPHHPKHALVYLADEKKHGVGFPSGIEVLIKSVLVAFLKGRKRPKFVAP